MAVGNKHNFYSITQFKGTPPFDPAIQRNSFDIILVRSGTVSVILNGQKTVLGQNDGVLILPRSLFVIRNADDAEYCTLSLDLQQADAETARYVPLLGNRLNSSAFLRAGDGALKGINSVIESEGGENAEKEIANLLQLIFGRRGSSAASVFDDKKQYAVTKIIEFLRAQFARSVTVEEVSEECGYSEFYCMKIFKQFTGYSIIDYANKIRIYVAAQRLTYERESVSDIARSVGFDNVSYFNRQFKRAYGVTPKVYRQQHR